ncbi:hypothetical protein [Actinokineospora pegani]|uniref:hypothetical protein n=1 Tax=Actinokineospora pegani TaxID=2654637 RepID=UPI0012EAFA07|nr:hypothetical protein [Actinokineospora pegani]
MQGKFGVAPTTAEITAWEEDDLATVASLRAAAAATVSPVVRRLIRDQLAWPSTHAKSIALRHAALTLVVALDNRPSDDLAELVVGKAVSGRLLRSGHVPDLREFVAAELARANLERGDEQQVNAQIIGDINLGFEQKRKETERLKSTVIDHLWNEGGPAHVVRCLDAVVRGAEAVELDRSRDTLLADFARLRPELTADFVHAAVENRPGPLDGHLQWLLQRWADSDETALLHWLHGFANHRREVRRAIAGAFVSAGWASRAGRFASVWQEGADDPDVEIADQFLLATHARLTDDPAATVDLILTRGIAPTTAATLLDYASGYGSSDWGRSLDDTAARAVLRLIRHCGWTAHSIEEVTAGIAFTHPRLVLDALTAAVAEDQTLPTGTSTLVAAFDRHADVLADWLADDVDLDLRSCRRVLRTVVESAFTPNQADHLAARLGALDAENLERFVLVLDEIRPWPLHHPALARDVIEAGRALSKAEQVDSLREMVAASMTLSAWGSISGHSAELERGKKAATSAIDTETDAELRTDQCHALEWYEQRLQQIANHFNDMLSQ